jgi:hypothetical protein
MDARPDGLVGAQSAVRMAARPVAHSGRLPASSATRCPAAVARPDRSASPPRATRVAVRPRAGTVPTACGGSSGLGSPSRCSAGRLAAARCRLGPARHRRASPCHASATGPSPAAEGRGRGAWPGPAEPGSTGRGSEPSRSRHPANRTGRCRRRGTCRAQAGRAAAALARPGGDHSDARSRTRNRRCEPEPADRSRW